MAALASTRTMSLKCRTDAMRYRKICKFLSLPITSLAILTWQSLGFQAAASLSSLVSAWGHDFSVTPFEQKELMIATATDKATGERFNIIKMPSGRLMVGVPVEQAKQPPKVEQADLVK